jgi:hypothetical protein
VLQVRSSLINLAGLLLVSDTLKIIIELYEKFLGGTINNWVVIIKSPLSMASIEWD